MTEAFEQMRSLMLAPMRNRATEGHSDDCERLRIHYDNQTIPWKFRRPPRGPKIYELINASRQAIGLIQQWR